MSENPFAAPQTSSVVTEASGVRSGEAGDVLRVARYQKGIIIAILVYLLSVGLTVAINVFALRALANNESLPVLLTRASEALAVVVLAAMLAGAVCVFLMAMKVYHPVVGIFMALLSLIPLLGLLVLLLMNARANKVLGANAFRVGLLGANLAEIKTRMSEG